MDNPGAISMAPTNQTLNRSQQKEVHTYIAPKVLTNVNNVPFEPIFFPHHKSSSSLEIIKQQFVY